MRVEARGEVTDESNHQIVENEFLYSVISFADILS